MKPKTLKFLFVLLFSNQNILICQNILKNTEISLGYSMLPQDRRLFDFPQSKEIIQQENSLWDFEYSVIVSKNIFPNKKFNLSPGIGYSVFQTKFGRPFSHKYFTNSLTKELRYIRKYLIHNLAISVSPAYVVLKNKNNSIYFNTPLLTKFAFNKYIDNDFGESQWKHNKVKFEFNKFEAYLGLGYRHKRTGFNISYRVLNIQKIDRVIFPFDLYYDTPIITIKNYETINISKFWINITYCID